MKEEAQRSQFLHRSNTSKNGAKRVLRALLVEKTDSVITQAVRFGLVGAVATVVDVAIFHSLNSAGLHYAISAAIGFLCGIIVSYCLSIQWVFRSRSLENRAAEFLAFAIIGIIGLGLTELVIAATVTILNRFPEIGGGVSRLAGRLIGPMDTARLYPLVGKGIAIVTVFIWNFGVRRLLLFRADPSERCSSSLRSSSPCSDPKREEGPNRS